MENPVENKPVQQHILYLQVILFVIIYITLGYILHLQASAYVLLGIPLTGIFQLYVRKQPIYKLWLRDEHKFYLNKWGWIISIFLIILPIYKIINSALESKLTIVLLGINIATIAGAFCAGYCYSKLTKKTAKDLLLCFIFGAIIRSVIHLLPLLTNNKKIQPDYIVGITSLLVYIPIAFVVEEVVFRGMLDTHVQSTKKSNGLLSAVFISVLWGLWHVPLSLGNGNPMWFVVAGPVVVSMWGIILSIFWRRSGNLSVTGFSHAFADAVRDMLVH